MKLDQSSSGIAIIGGWNSHIFTTPRWIKRYLFPEEKFTLELQGQLPQSLSGQFLQPCISSKDIRILLQGNKLNLIPLKNGDENLDRIQDLALQLADYLPHTPVSGYGVNFLFSEDHINEDLVDLVRPRDLEKIEQFGVSLTGEEYTRRLESNERILNFTVGLENERTTFKFNFHFKINDLVAFKAGISKISILELKQEATQFIAEIYNLELKGEIE